MFCYKYNDKLINFILIFVDNSTTSSSLQWAGVVTVKDNTDNVREEQDLILEEVEDDNSVLIEVYLHVYIITCTQCMRLSQYSVVNNKYNLLHVFLGLQRFLSILLFWVKCYIYM